MRDTADKIVRHQAQVFLGHGGELGALIRAYDWAGSPMGPPEGWPQSLKTAVRLMLTSRHPMFIWWGPELIQLYNDAYRETMGPERHPSALGQRGRECWDEIWPIIGPQIELVMRGEGSTWHEDQLVPVTRHGGLQQVWWTYGYSPIDIEGGVGGVLVVCKDVTQEHLTREALARANEMLSSDLNRLKDLFGQAPGFMAVLGGPDHVYEFNAAYERLVGRTDIAGKNVGALLPEVEAQGFIALLDEVYSTGKAHVGTSVPLRIDRDGETKNLFLDFVYQPIRDAAGRVTGIFVEGSDVTARVEADQRRELLSLEMNHRIKNLLAMVQALVMLSGKHATSVEDYKTSLNARIQAVVKTQVALIEGHRGVDDVEGVLEAELAPYFGEQLKLDCEALKIAADDAISLGLIVHELLTNATKYGALSTPGGRLHVTCKRSAGEGCLGWRETTEHPVPAPRAKGFGTVLIERLAQGLGGGADLAVLPTGLNATITFRLDD